MPLVIFDYNRTLYDPDTGDVVSGAIETLSVLQSWEVSLHLISRKEAGRFKTFHDLGFDRYFSSICFVEDKSCDVFRMILGRAHVLPEDAYVVGDYLHEEIRFGNQCGMRTIWLRRGKFSTLVPEGPYDTPWRVVSGLDEILPLIESAAMGT